jgi:O-methyltransferase
MDAPAQQYQRLRKLIPKKLHPYLRGLRKRIENSRQSLSEPFRTVYPFTQVHLFRQENLLALCRDIDHRGVPGAIVECGVLDGGTAALMAYGSKDRPVHLFDSWEGLPQMTEKDGDAGMWVGDVIGSPRRVVNILKLLNVDISRVSFHKGWFEQTFQTASIPKIALLHIDADFYESVKLSLKTWEPHVLPGGYIQIDDYSSFIGCKHAVDEYLAQRPDLRLETYKDIAFFIHKQNA